MKKVLLSPASFSELSSVKTAKKLWKLVRGTLSEMGSSRLYNWQINILKITSIEAQTPFGRNPVSWDSKEAISVVYGGTSSSTNTFILLFLKLKKAQEIQLRML